ncbi:hypothetical protein ADUPG1_006859 [Aduncisulcus paluster]|uniref:Uncharacterized protein n=1 Tax=Aduncisulcus paluster TaxID=2918883 RepID=A0ABQ5KJT9_9EUKA|nr:hypothetical protein ADUPG1_006859 [Aduncisulcus paluster]
MNCAKKVELPHNIHTCTSSVDKELHTTSLPPSRSTPHHTHLSSLVSPVSQPRSYGSGDPIYVLVGCVFVGPSLENCAKKVELPHNIHTCTSSVDKELHTTSLPPSRSTPHHTHLSSLVSPVSQPRSYGSGDPIYVRDFPSIPMPRLSLHKLILKDTLARIISLESYHRYRMASLEDEQCLDIPPLPSLYQVRRYLDTVDNYGCKHKGISYVGFGSIIKSLRDESSVFKHLSHFSPYISPPSRPSYEPVAYSSYGEALKTFSKDMGIEVGSQRPFSASSLTEYVRECRIRDIAPMVFVRVILFVDGVATALGGNTALSMKLSLVNIMTTCRSMNGAWRESCVMKEDKNASTLPAEIILIESRKLQSGFKIPTMEGPAFIFGSLQAVVADHPQRCDFTCCKRNRCLWCHAEKLEMLFGIKRTPRSHLQTGLFPTTASDDFVPRHLFLSDPLHMFQLGIISSITTLVKTITSPEGQREVDSRLRALDEEEGIADEELIARRRVRSTMPLEVSEEWFYQQLVKTITTHANYLFKVLFARAHNPELETLMFKHREFLLPLAWEILELYGCAANIDSDPYEATTLSSHETSSKVIEGKLDGKKMKIILHIDEALSLDSNCAGPGDKFGIRFVLMRQVLIETACANDEGSEESFSELKKVIEGKLDGKKMKIILHIDEALSLDSNCAGPGDKFGIRFVLMRQVLIETACHLCPDPAQINQFLSKGLHTR